MITAPYNFVPLNKQVFYPPWADDISHDIPFSDGESGEIEITIEAKSPIFVRDSNNEEEFCNFNGNYIIPGSSVKGMVRNVLEILSFSKMSFIDDRTYAVRDLSSAKNFYMQQMNLIEEPITQCGWLKKSNNGYVIEDCGEPGRISHAEIDKAFNADFAKHFKKPLFNAQDAKQKTAEYKYNKLGQLTPKITVGSSYSSTTNPKYDKRKFHKYSKNGKEGTLVLTGQPTARENTGKMGDGKGFEFVFFKSKQELPVDTKVFENFKFAYFDERDTEPKESPDWKFWKKKLYNGEKIPVFFQKDKTGKVLHFGLSYLYKLPYNYSTKDGLFEAHNSSNIDLAEAIFGYTRDKDALKGRVQFSHFKAIKDTVKILKARTEVLGTPRASYYPNYVKQTNNANPYITYMNFGFKISGWKRYPVQKNIQNYTLPTNKDGKVNTNVGTTFRPLDKGVVFKGKMRYHNLKKAELGAILSALTFHNTNDCYHNLGLAKPLGYGKIKIKINGIEMQDYLKEFEEEVAAVIDNWTESEQIIELLTMAKEQDNSKDSELRYMELTQFAKNKVAKNYLKNYSKLTDIKTIKPISLADQNSVSVKREYYKKIEEEREAIKKAQEAKRLEKIKENNDWHKAKSSNSIQSLETFVKNYANSYYVEEAKELIAKLKQEEADAKWEAIHKPNNLKYLKDALEKFINDYPKAKQINEAKKELEELNTTKKEDNSISVNELKEANDSRKFKSILEANKETLENHKELIKTEAIRLYKSLKGKKQKNFFKEIQLGRFLDKSFEDKVKNSI